MTASGLWRRIPSPLNASARSFGLPAFVYILRCRDGRYYVGTTRGSLERRLAEHNAGLSDGFTAARRPVELVYWQEFQRITDAISAERQLKGWSRAKKEALIRGDLAALPALSRSRTPRPTAAAGPEPAPTAPTDEDPRATPGSSC